MWATRSLWHLILISICCYASQSSFSSSHTAHTPCTCNLYIVHILYLKFYFKTFTKLQHNTPFWLVTKMRNRPSSAIECIILWFSFWNLHRCECFVAYIWCQSSVFSPQSSLKFSNIHINMRIQGTLGGKHLNHIS